MTPLARGVAIPSRLIRIRRRPTVPQQDSFETVARKERFVANLQRLMDGHGYSIHETAQRAGIRSRKRFYRWATSGIARAAKDHHDDLDRLQRLFRLANWTELWGDSPAVSMEDQLIAGVLGQPDYGYAAKVLYLLRTLTATDSGDLRRHIDRVFNEATRDDVPDEVLPMLTPKQAIERLRRLDPSAYQSIVDCYGTNFDKLQWRSLPALSLEQLAAHTSSRIYEMLVSTEEVERPQLRYLKPKYRKNLSQFNRFKGPSHWAYPLFVEWLAEEWRKTQDKTMEILECTAHVKWPEIVDYYNSEAFSNWLKARAERKMAQANATHADEAAEQKAAPLSDDDAGASADSLDAQGGNQNLHQDDEA